MKYHKYLWNLSVDLQSPSELIKNANTVEEFSGYTVASGTV